MANKQLRNMSRTELIEIIYALQQNEQQLRSQIEELTGKLEDRTIRLEESGSIAEAALSLNHIFEDAEQAVQQYLASVQSGQRERDEREEASALLREARRQADQMLADTKAQCERERESLAQERKHFLQEAAEIIKQNPELARSMTQRQRTEDPKA